MTGSLIAHEAIGIGIVSVIAISVLIVADLVKRFTNIPGEHTRKLAHIGSGLGVLLIPVVIDSSWTVLVLTAGFAGLMFATHKAGLLQGVHGVERGVGGVLWYPATAWLVFVIVFDIRDGTYLDYAIPILVLACADAMGALVGKRWGRHRYEVIAGHYRSIEGSTAFLLVAMSCIAVPLIVGMSMDPLRALVVALLVSVVVTAYEAVSVHGLDNVLVPMGAYLFLERFDDMSWPDLGTQAALIAGIFGVSLTLRARHPVSGGGFVAFLLAVHTVLVLGGWQWLPPLAVLVAVFLVTERMTSHARDTAPTKTELGTSLVGLTVPVALVLLHAAVRDEHVRDALYVAYVASIVCQGAVQCFLLPQDRGLWSPRLRRVLASREPWQQHPNAGKLTLAVTGALVIGVPLALAQPSASGSLPVLGLPLTMLTVGVALASFITLAGTRPARRECAVCGTIGMHGYECCQDDVTPVLTLGGAVAARTLSFRVTYLVANISAALAAVALGITWMS